jgi:uncharacterized membrane protein YcaP (DUF421 family)
VFFDGWIDLGRVLAAGAFAYIGLIVLLRISGKRTLTKMNAFDLVVTVALGSTLATILLSRDVALAEGMLGFAVLIALQFLVTWSSVRSDFIARLIKSDPSLLYYRGDMLTDALRGERVTPAEVRAAVRSQGISQMEEVEAVILETDGTFSVLRTVGKTPSAGIEDIRNYPPTSQAE